MTAITRDLIEINLSTDELMLKELERRDGIYSFIFHELEVPKVDTPTAGISPSKIMNNNYKTTTTRNTTTPTTISDEANSNDNTDNDDNNNSVNDNNNYTDNLPDELKITTKSMFIPKSTSQTAIATITVASTTRTIAFTSPVTTSFINTFPTNGSSASAISTNGAGTTIIVPSLFTTSSLTTTPSTAGISAASNTLPAIPSLSDMGMRSYNDYLKTWHPPPSLVYDNPKLYAYMANCGFRVRVPTPRFSHISAPLVRNRRHALKETPEYKRMCDFCMCAPVVDLRELFPHDPDVHAPFAMTMEVTLNVLGEDEIGSVELDDVGCCGDDMVLMSGTTLLK